ncbi:MAG: glycosyltransferase [Syntrophales bacterium]
MSGSLLVLLKNLLIFPKALWLARLARIWRADHIHAHWALSTSTMAMIAGVIARVPWSFTAHRGDIVENNMLGVKLSSATFVRFISKSGLPLAQSIIKEKLPLTCHVIHMGVKLPENLSLKRKDVGECFTIICPANLLPVKGHIYLLQAIAALKGRRVQCRLLLAGSGPLSISLRQQVNVLNINDRVVFLGQLSHHALLQLYLQRMVDLLVLPSVDLGDGHHEGIPVSLMEAMAYGIPVIATATGGIPELVSENNGILVPQKNSVALADAIERLLMDTDLLYRLALAGNQSVNVAFNAEDTVTELCKLIRNQNDTLFENPTSQDGLI